MRRTRIIGTGKALPEKVLTNRELEGMVETTDQWIIERTGIRERRILEEGRTTSDLAAEAGRAALLAAQLGADAIDALIVCTVTPDYSLPACAVTVQRKLGATCAAFDVSAACAGFIYGLAVGDGLIQSGNFRRVLVIGAEVMSRIIDWKDRNTCVLFGDGAGAAVLAADEGERGILSTHLYADGTQAEALWVPGGGVVCPASKDSVESGQHFIKMSGRGVFAHAVRNLARAQQAALDKNGIEAAQIDCVVAHQANIRILEAVAEKTRMPMSKFHINIDRYGNTSSASIPIVLDEAVREGKIRANDLVLMSALGAGFSWGSALVRW